MLKVFEHFGSISIDSIKKKTNAKRVLVPVNGRVQVPGTSLICSGTIYLNTEGKAVTGVMSTPMPMWEYTYYENQRDAVIIPARMMDRLVQKNSVYRIVQLRDKLLWIEKNSKNAKVGKPYQLNMFLLMFD